MPSSLQPLGEVSYGNVDFGVFLQTLEFSAKPVYDSAGRTIVYVVYTIRLGTELITDQDAGQTSDDYEGFLEDLQNELLTPALTLSYKNHGAGLFIINAGRGGKQDVLWGPKPTHLSLKPLGGGSTYLEWACEVAIPRCDTASYITAIMEFNYRVSFSQDLSNYTKRTYSGYLRIPQTRFGDNRGLLDNADLGNIDYFSRIIPQLPTGFRRGPVERTLDASKCRLDFTFTDEEMPRPLPIDVVVLNASHRIQSGIRNFYVWTGTYSASIEMAKPVARTDAFSVFIRLLLDRASYAFKYGQMPPLGQGVTASNQSLFMPIQFSFTEPDIFGKNIAECSCTYTTCTTQKTIIQASGLWTQVDPTIANDQTWRDSNGNIANFPRGWTNLRFSNDNDKIIDLCLQPSGAVNQISSQTTLQAGQLATLGLPLPDQNNSWLAYQNSIRFEQTDMMATHHPLQSTMRAIQDTTSIMTPFDPNGQQNGGGVPQTNQLKGYNTMYSNNIGQPTGIFQSRGQPDLYAIMEGYALRAGFLIEQPTLDSVAGAPVVPVNIEGVHGFRNAIVANWFGVPIVRAAWILRYQLTRVPTQNIGVPPNPLPS